MKKILHVLRFTDDDLNQLKLLRETYKLSLRKSAKAFTEITRKKYLLKLFMNGKRNIKTWIILRKLKNLKEQSILK